MRVAFLTLGLATLALAQPPSTPGVGPLPSLRDPREVHLKNVRQLTFGGQNAEAYWSFDGKKVIFQYMKGGRGRRPDLHHAPRWQWQENGLDGQGPLHVRLFPEGR